ncbi:MAG TPA: hypothetical protein VJL80_09770 [Aeromicrobium sp.]|nr:hypothetical protein [Aeromicrobium sp.]HKY58313.1 hypothetical protein [Aeromicrobium sp.]
MALSISTTLASTLANAVTAAVDAGPAAGTLKVYTGAKPATVATAPSGTLLATFTLADPSLAAAVAGVADFDFDPDISVAAVASGDPGWFRIADSTGAGVLDGTVGTSGADMTIPAPTWTAGSIYELASGTLTAPTS